MDGLLLLSAALAVAQAETPAPLQFTVPVLRPPAAAAPPPAAPSTPPTEPWLVMKCLQGTGPGDFLNTERIRVSGWTDISYTASSDHHDQLPLGFNFRANEFLLQQNWLRVERTVVQSGTTEPTFGFRCDTILPGTDYRFTEARGLFSGQLTASNGQPNEYGFDPVQFYAEAYFPTVGRGMDVKFGRVFCQYGVESIDAISNVLGSRSYAMIYDPFTHTGLMATIKVTDAWSYQIGIMMGDDVFIDPSATPHGMGSIKWAPPNGRDSVLFSVILGSGRFNEGRNFHNPEIFDLVYTHKCNARLNYSFETLYGFTHNFPIVDFANWLGVLNYLTWDFTPRLSGTVRLEFFDDFQGQRTGFEGLYTAFTAGVNFRPRKDVIFRPEVRYDYNNESRPFEGNHGVFTATADLILRW
jgi:hypothetical protein